MGRFLYLMHRTAGSAADAGAASSLPWLGLATASFSLPLVYGSVVHELSGLWPVLVAAVLTTAVLRRRPSALVHWVGSVPPRDILDPLMRSLRRLGAFLDEQLTVSRNRIGTAVRAFLCRPGECLLDREVV